MNYRKILENYIYGNKDTMKEQLVEAIKYILDENNELKSALKINHDLYESKCNQNTKLEEENKELKKVKTDGFMVNNPWLFKYLSEVYIPKSLVKEKFQRKRNEIFGCTYVDDEQWRPFDKALDIINDLEQDLLGEEKQDV